FFQAEDGIRDRNVTGVQTCALPICGEGQAHLQLLIGVALGMVLRVVFAAIMAAGDFIGLQMGLAFATFVSPDSGANTMILARLRSEERRVGKDGRSGWWGEC